MSLDQPNLCTLCNKPNARLCNRCKSPRYCSTSCQQVDWPTHKLLCAAFSDFDTSSRPTEDHFRAILFPVDNKKPKVVWLQYMWHKDAEGLDRLPNVEPFLGSDTVLKDMTVVYNPVLKRELSDTLHLCYRNTFRVDGSKVNNSIAAITASKPGTHHDWRGPIIACGMVGRGSIVQTISKDIDLNDFRHITDYLLSYQDKDIPVSKQDVPAPKQHIPAPQQPVGGMVKGVRINCLGDRKMFKKPLFEAIEVPSTHPIFTDHDTSDIAKLIGFSIFTQRCPPDPKWVNTAGNKIYSGGNPYDNQEATFLHLCCDPKARPGRGILGWGWAHAQWQDHVGSAIVVRQDKKPFSILHAEALCGYCHQKILPILGHSMGECAPEVPMSKAAVLAKISRPTFLNWWSNMLGDKWIKKAQSPYDV